MKLLAEIYAPTEVINDEFVIIQSIDCHDREEVKKGQDIIQLETSKSVVSVEAPIDGFIELLCRADDEVEVGGVIAKIWSSAKPSSKTKTSQDKTSESKAAVTSLKAKEYIAAKNLDISDLAHDGLISLDMVRAYNNAPKEIELKTIIRNVKPNHLNIIFIGTGLHADTLHTIITAQKSQHVNIVGIITHDANIVGNKQHESIVIGTEQQCTPSFWAALISHNIHVAIGYSFKDKRVCKARERIITSAEDAGVSWHNIQHRSALIEHTANTGKGTQIAQGAIIGNNVNIGTGCIINSGVIISHDCNIGDNTHIAPGAVLGGNVNIGKNCLIGMNSTVFADVKIPDDTFIANMENINTKDKF
ncbi:transferase family hexapeptide repeat protein [Sinobacterium caligoides]|uniref:Transferase family hexapeptide repeat protein n=1 Tax=Sinobacterium caligoides TaxID=933926 RepID=A0A3N2DRB6_9GAMM|nr:biotin/lipoyl-containing protein [Sinobacterium caligoides]ROS01845.1 transferase family hexapeptide repeat protein [Sinobacterium caligoides]